MCHSTLHGTHCPFLWSIHLNTENECFWLLFFHAPKYLDIEVPLLFLWLLLFCKDPTIFTLIFHLPDLRWWPLQPGFLLRNQWKGLSICCKALSGIICLPCWQWAHPKICLTQSEKVQIPALQVQTLFCSVALSFPLNQTRLHTSACTAAWEASSESLQSSWVKTEKLLSPTSTLHKRYSHINHAGAFSDNSNLSIKFLVPIAVGGRFVIHLPYCKHELCPKTSHSHSIVMLEDIFFPKCVHVDAVLNLTAQKCSHHHVVVVHPWSNYSQILIYLTTSRSHFLGEEIVLKQALITHSLGLVLRVDWI